MHLDTYILRHITTMRVRLCKKGTKRVKQTTVFEQRIGEKIPRNGAYNLRSRGTLVR